MLTEICIPSLNYLPSEAKSELLLPLEYILNINQVASWYHLGTPIQSIQNDTRYLVVVLDSPYIYVKDKVQHSQLGQTSRRHTKTGHHIDCILSDNDQLWHGSGPVVVPSSGRSWLKPGGRRQVCVSALFPSLIRVITAGTKPVVIV